MKKKLLNIFLALSLSSVAHAESGRLLETKDEAAARHAVERNELRKGETLGGYQDKLGDPGSPVGASPYYYRTPAPMPAHPMPPPSSQPPMDWRERLRR